MFRRCPSHKGLPATLHIWEAQSQGSSTVKTFAAAWFALAVSSQPLLAARTQGSTWILASRFAKDPVGLSNGVLRVSSRIWAPEDHRIPCLQSAVPAYKVRLALEAIQTQIFRCTQGLFPSSPSSAAAPAYRYCRQWVFLWRAFSQPSATCICGHCAGACMQMYTVSFPQLQTCFSGRLLQHSLQSQVHVHEPVCNLVEYLWKFDLNVLLFVPSSEKHLISMSTM